jgi:hypothetical protein
MFMPPIKGARRRELFVTVLSRVTPPAEIDRGQSRTHARRSTDDRAIPAGTDPDDQLLIVAARTRT